MKSKILIAGLICVATIPPATAVTKCVKLTPSTICSDNGTTTTSQPEWHLTCDGVPVHGIGFCSSQRGASIGATTDNLETSISTDENRYCWCRMISPAVSRWVYSEYFYANSDCVDLCAYSCSQYASDATDPDIYRPILSAMFGSLSD